MVQQGAGTGTVDRQRREPRMRVQDVGVAEASGLTLGPDGYPHPAETDAFGQLKVQGRDVVSVLEEILAKLDAIHSVLLFGG